jgi:hypothetical protein
MNQQKSSTRTVFFSPPPGHGRQGGPTGGRGIKDFHLEKKKVAMKSHWMWRFKDDFIDD